MLMTQIVIDRATRVVFDAAFGSAAQTAVAALLETTARAPAIKLGAQNRGSNSRSNARAQSVQSLDRPPHPMTRQDLDRPSVESSPKVDM